MSISLKDYKSLNNPRVLTSALTLGEIETFQGNRFYFEYDRVFAEGEVQYLIVRMANASDKKTSTFQNRSLKTMLGSAEIDILLESTGYTIGDSIDTFNENTSSDNTAVTLINEISTPTIDGIIRERDFIPESTGVGQSTSGGINSDLGFRLYEQGAYAVIKLTNTYDDDQRIRLSYTWFEIDDEDLSVD